MKSFLNTHLKKTAAVCLAGLLAIGGTSAVIASGDDDGDDKVTSAMVQEAQVTMEQAIATAQADTAGTVIETELENDDGQLVWEVELVSANDQITEFEIDAKTGKILEKETEF